MEFLGMSKTLEEDNASETLEEEIKSWIPHTQWLNIWGNLWRLVERDLQNTAGRVEEAGTGADYWSNWSSSLLVEELRQLTGGETGGHRHRHCGGGLLHGESGGSLSHNTGTGNV